MTPLHPLTVHLPIGLLVGNAILTLLYLRRGERAYEISAYHCLWLGWLFILPAILSGTYEAVRHLFDPVAPRNDALAWINAHAIVGVAVMVVYWQAWQTRRRRPGILDDPERRRGYLVLLGLGLLLLLASGWIGGHLVYVLRIGVET